MAQKALCFEYAPPTCHHAAVPEAHLAPATLCNGKSSEDCTQLPSGEGLDTDFVVYFTAEPSVACNTKTRALPARPYPADTPLPSLRAMLSGLWMAP